MDTKNRLEGARGGRSAAGEINEKVQTFSRKVNTLWRCDVQHDDYYVFGSC